MPPNALRVIPFIGLLAPPAVSLASCGDGTTSAPTAERTPASGGARFRLQATSGATCGDLRTEVRISRRGDDGIDRLVVDGVDGASVDCKVGATSFRVRVAAAGRALEASGTIAEGIAKGAKLSFTLGTTTYVSAPPEHCDVVVTENRAGTLRATFGCARVEHPTSGACSIASLEGDLAYFNFKGCSPP